MVEGILEKLPSKRWGIYESDNNETLELTSGDIFQLEVLGKWETLRMEYIEGEYKPVPYTPIEAGMKAKWAPNKRELIK